MAKEANDVEVGIPGLDLTDHIIARNLYLWSRIQQNRIICSNRDIQKLRPVRKQSGIYLHRNRPGSIFETVGIIVGYGFRNSQPEYLVDDGTYVISVHPIKIGSADALAQAKANREGIQPPRAISPPPPNPCSEGIPEEYRPPIPQSIKTKEEDQIKAKALKEKFALQEEQTQVQIGIQHPVGSLVRVAGRIKGTYKSRERLFDNATIEVLTDLNEESLHIRKAIRLARTTYSERFILPELPADQLAAPTRKSKLYGLWCKDEVEEVEVEDNEEGAQTKEATPKKQKSKLQLALFGDEDELVTEDESEAGNQSTTENKSEVGDESVTEDESEVESKAQEKRSKITEARKPQEKLPIKGKGKESLLYRVLFSGKDEEEDDDDDEIEEEESAIFKQQNTPKASTSKLSSFSKAQDQASDYFSSLTPKASNQPPRSNQTSAGPSNGIGRSFDPSPKGFKKSSSGIGGVGSSSSNLKRELTDEVKESRKRQRSASQVSDAPNPSKKSVKEWSKLRPSQQSVGTFRFYVRMHINKFCRASNSSRLKKREPSSSSRHDSRKRNGSQSYDLGTPKSARGLSNRRGDESNSILCPSSDSEEESRISHFSTSQERSLHPGKRREVEQPPSFTLAYLMRVKDLRNHARELVRVLHKKESQKSVSSKKSSSNAYNDLSDYELEKRVCKLFSEALNEMRLDGSLVVANHQVISRWPFNGKLNLDLSDQNEEDEELETRFERSILVEGLSSSQTMSSPSSRSVGSTHTTPSRERRGPSSSVSSKPDPFIESFEELQMKSTRREQDPFSPTNGKSRNSSAYQNQDSSIKGNNSNQLRIFKVEPTFYQLVSSTLLLDPISTLLKSRKLQGGSSNSFSTSVSLVNLMTQGLKISSILNKLKQDDRWEYLSEDKLKECLDKMKERRLVKVENRMWEWVGRK